MRIAEKTFLTAVVALVALSSSACSDDCDAYCDNQSSFIDQCLPEFGQSWADVGDGNWDAASTFSAACTENIADWIEDDIETACAGAEDGSDEADACADTIRQGTLRACGEHLNDFRVSCTDYWQGTLDFIPGSFDPEQPGDDDDSAVGDDDDSAVGDDDDSAVGDDDDSAAGDDDDSAAGDDDDSAAGDDDDSAADDDDSAAS